MGVEFYLVFSRLSNWSPRFERVLTVTFNTTSSPSDHCQESSWIANVCKDSHIVLLFVLRDTGHRVGGLGQATESR